MEILCMHMKLALLEIVCVFTFCRLLQWDLLTSRFNWTKQTEKNVQINTAEKLNARYV